MTRRALLIGSQTFGLTGCDADVALVKGLLGDQGFDPIQTLTGEAASREGIVTAIEALTAAAGSEDARSSSTTRDTVDALRIPTGKHGRPPDCRAICSSSCRGTSRAAQMTTSAVCSPKS